MVVVGFKYKKDALRAIVPRDPIQEYRRSLTASALRFSWLDGSPQQKAGQKPQHKMEHATWDCSAKTSPILQQY